MLSQSLIITQASPEDISLVSTILCSNESAQIHYGMLIVDRRRLRYSTITLRLHHVQYSSWRLQCLQITLYIDYKPHISLYSHWRLQCLHITLYICCKPYILAMCSLYIIFIQVIYQLFGRHIYSFYHTYISNLTGIYNICITFPISPVPCRSENNLVRRPHKLG